MIFQVSTKLSPQSSIKNHKSTMLSVPDDFSGSWYDLLASKGYHLPQSCGGLGLCGSCKIQFLKNAPDALDDDRLALSAEEIDSGWRLACKHLPQTGESIHNDNLILHSAPSDEKFNDFQKNAKTDKNRASVENHSGYGIAVDLGTTSIVAELWQINPPQRVQRASVYNGQRKYGADLITRLAFAENSPQNLEMLTNIILKDLTLLFEKLLADQDLSPNAVEFVTISGNTVMNHFLCGINPVTLAYPPYEPPQIQPIFPFAQSLLPRAKFFIFPNLHGYLGGDTVSNILTLETIYAPLPKSWALIDLGTNCEIVLANKGIYHLASAAAGPAFEGARIQWGMTANPGAIIDIDELTEHFRTIDNAPPVGIAGSGLLHLIHHFVKKGIIHPSGQISPKAPEKLLSLWKGAPAIQLYQSKNHTILLTQNDIREFQLAKGAIRAALFILLEEAGLEIPEKIFISGAFGKALRPQILVEIGLLSPIDSSDIILIGNGSLTGAALALFDAHRLNVSAIRSKSIYHELTNHPDFQEKFALAMELASDEIF
jgi:uncharacterized 2Fe-2S/4Fe-4S cluster protein (DUF4445 family)